MRRSPFPLAALLLASLALSASVGACAPAEASRAGATEAAAHLDEAIDPAVRTAVQVHRAMRTDPAGGDSILAAARLTAQQFEWLMHRIASDSALSADYQRLIQ